MPNRLWLYQCADGAMMLSMAGRASPYSRHKRKNTRYPALTDHQAIPEDSCVAVSADQAISILFLADHFSREIEIAQRTVAALNRSTDMRCTAYMMPQDIYGDRAELSFRKIFHLRPDIIVTPTLNDAQAWLVPLATLMGSKIVIQHSEQFLIEAAQKHKFASLSSLKLRNVAHLSWTASHRNQLIAGGVPPNQVYVSGSPKLAARSAAADALRPRPSRFGCISNFPTADMTDDQIDQLIDSFGIASRYPIHKRLKTLRSRFITMIARAAKLNPHAEFIVRAHPGEFFTDYHSVLGEAPNIRFSRDEPFPDFLEQIDAAIIHDSTSIFEIAHRKLPLISVDLGPVDREWIQQPASIFKGARPKDVMQFVKDPSLVPYTAKDPELLNNIRSQLEGYDDKVPAIYSDIVEDRTYVLRWRDNTLKGFVSFCRSLAVQCVDQLSEKLGRDLISTASRNSRKQERYGKALEVTKIAG
jgi:hypothetical protein